MVMGPPATLQTYPFTAHTLLKARFSGLHYIILHYYLYFTAGIMRLLSRIYLYFVMLMAQYRVIIAKSKVSNVLLIHVIYLMLISL